MKKILLVTILLTLTSCGKKAEEEKNPYYSEVTVRTQSQNPRVTSNPLDDEKYDYTQEIPTKVNPNTNNNSTHPRIPIINQANEVPKDPNAPKKISFFDIAEHNLQSDCWGIVDRQVFDLTKWLPIHPGGPLKLLQECGKDVTHIFRDQPGGLKKMLKKLKPYKIGDLK